jgi:ABC-type glycerol-3-phosphate transport system substrate-binding protein
MATATHFPYVAAWSRVDTFINESLDAALLGKMDSRAALDEAAAAADVELAK